jgi:predicted nucleic acid-binding protein
MVGTKAYVDASVLLRRILNQPGAMEDWLTAELVVTSELLQAEAIRTLDRLRIAGQITDSGLAVCVGEIKSYLNAFELVPIQSDILRRAAGAFPTPIGTLDAIHLSTALIWMESNPAELILFTHDRQLATAARASGLDVKTSLR